MNSSSNYNCYQLFTLSMSQRKIDIPHSYRSDFTMLQEEANRAIAYTLKELNFVNKEHLRQIVERRLREILLNSAARFRNSAQYTKDMGKNKQRVIMEADTSLQKINEVKSGMLKESVLKAKREKFPQVDIPISVSIPTELKVQQTENFREREKQTVQRVLNQLPSHTEDIKKILEIQNLEALAIRRIQGQQKLDRQYFQKR